MCTDELGELQGLKEGQCGPVEETITVKTARSATGEAVEALRRSVQG